MVADTVEVASRKAGETQSWTWRSDGKGSFTIAESDAELRGTRIVLHMREDAAEFLETSRLRHIVQTYSDHIPIPIHLVEAGSAEIGRAHVCTPVTNAHLVCRLLLAKK